MTNEEKNCCLRRHKKMHMLSGVFLKLHNLCLLFFYSQFFIIIIAIIIVIILLYVYLFFNKNIVCIKMERYRATKTMIKYIPLFA